MKKKSKHNLNIFKRNWGDFIGFFCNYLPMQSLYIIAHWKVRKHWLLKTTNCTYNRINSSNSITVSLMMVTLLCMHAVIYKISKNLSFLLDILCIFKFRTIETTILIDTCTCINIWCTCIWLARKSIYLILIPKG